MATKKPDTDPTEALDPEADAPAVPDDATTAQPARVTHPTIPDLHHDVPPADVEEWVQQGWKA